MRACLGPRMKYSCCLYPEGDESLQQAEMAMLHLYKTRAELEDGMNILDLGYVTNSCLYLWNLINHTQRCGWGSGALYFAETFPNSTITAFSNSKTQKQYIDDKARDLGLKNLEVITGNVVDYEFERNTYDRVVSIEVWYLCSRRQCPTYTKIISYSSTWRTTSYWWPRFREL